MKQAEIQKMHVWLSTNYTAEQTITKADIADKFGLTLRSVDRHLTLLGLHHIKPMKRGPKPKGLVQKVSMLREEKQTVLPPGALPTRHGFVMQQGAKTVHVMRG